MTEKLFKASEYKLAEAEHKRDNPTKGDYWWEDSESSSFRGEAEIRSPWERPFVGC